MVICGQEFEFSMMNANDLDRFEDANERMQRRSAEEAEQFQRGGVRLGDHARAQARIAMDCIDEILGAGASARLGLNENYMAPIYDVIEELGNAFAAEKQRYAAKPSQPMNREQRRAQAKKNRHKPPVSYPAPPAARMVERVDKATRRKQLLAELAALDGGETITEENTYIRGESEMSYKGTPSAVPSALTDEQKTDQLIDARQAVNAMRDDPEALQLLAAYALQVAAERHV